MAAIKNTPFKFLDSFNEADSDYFFGRDSEIDLLFDFIRRNRFVLVYGPSGCGKTSLVRSGLQKKFGSDQWYPIVIRRAADINESIQKTIFKRRTEVIKKTSSSRNNSGSGAIVDDINALSNYLLTPVFLIFEQFEELLLFGTDKEKTDFNNFLKELKHSPDDANCSVIFVMREEFFGLLDKFEKTSIDISSRRLRVDPMQRSDIEDVIFKTLNYVPFNITLEELQYKNVKKIYKALYSDESTGELAYLQIYLGVLWEKIYKETYHKKTFQGTIFPEVTITRQDIEGMGMIGNVLEAFFSAQTEVIHKKMREGFKEYQEDFLGKVLNEFVSDYGTKIPIIYNFDVNSRKYIFPKKSEKEFFKDLNELQLQAVIHELSESRIVRKSSSTMELIHDKLAKIIFNRRGEKERKLGEIRLTLKNLREVNHPVSYDVIRSWIPYISEAGLAPDEMQFFNRSLRRVEREFRKQQYLKYAARRKSRTWGTIVLGLGSLCILLYFLIQWALRKADSYYAKSFASYNLRRVSNSVQRLQLLSYLYYFRDNYDTDAKRMLQQTILDNILDTAIQNKMVTTSYQLDVNGAIEPGDISISDDGLYYLLKNDTLPSLSGPRNFDLIRFDTGQKRMAKIASFQRTTYAYFVHGTDSLLVARTNGGDSGVIQNPLSPNQYMIYNYKNNDSLGEFKRLPHYGVLFDQKVLSNKYRSVYDNYLVKYSLINGSLIVPYNEIVRDTSGNLNLSGRVLVQKNSDHSKVLISRYSASLSKDGRFLLTSEKNQVGGTTIKYTDLGRTLEKSRVISLNNNRAFDFTSDGKIWTLQGNTLKICTLQDDGCFYSRSLNYYALYAYIDYNAGNALLIQNDNKAVFLDLRRSIDQPLPGDLVGTNSDISSFVVRKKGTDSDSLISFTVKEGNAVAGEAIQLDKIVNWIYNQESGSMLILTGNSDEKKGRLTLIDRNLNVKNVIGVELNCSYGFNKIGTIFYYVQNQRLSIVDNLQRIENLQNFSTFERWFRNSDYILSNEECRALRDSFNLGFPSQKVLLRRRNVCRMTD